MNDKKPLPEVSDVSGKEFAGIVAAICFVAAIAIFILTVISHYIFHT